MDALTLAIMAAFLGLFAALIRRYLQHPGSLELAVVLVFSSTAALFAISLINRILPGLMPYLTPVAVGLLVAQPVLMVRLVALIVPVPRWSVPVAVLGFIVVTTGYFAANRSPAATLLLVGYFAITEFAAAAVLIREGRWRTGFPRLRLTTAGVASVMFGASILLAGLATAARGGPAPADSAITVLSRLLALLAGLGYLAAFVTPRWLRELGHRALAFDLVRSIVARPSGTQPAILWAGLAAVAGDILGTSDVRILTHDPSGTAGPSVAAEAAAPPSVRPTDRPAVPVVVELVTEAGAIGRLEATLPGQPLFLEDDLALLRLLGSLTARAVEREQMILSLGDARREVAEAAAVRASEARFRALLDAEPNAMLSVDRDGVILWCTRSADLLFGAGAPGLVGRALDAVIAPVDEAQTFSAPDGSVTRYETTATRLDGGTFPAEVAISTLRLDDAPTDLVVVADISWRREAEAIRDRFIGVLSHELRTPITSIFGGTQVLLTRGDRLDDATRTDLLTDVAAEAERLQGIVENLLVLARVERNADVVEAAPVLLQRVVPAVVARERAIWPAMSLAVAIPPDLSPASGDEASLALIVRNLISNAGKYAGPTAHVDVTVTQEHRDSITLRVTDDGPGIAPDEADQVFGLYFRSQRSRTAAGSGIGLFVCRELVAAMGGQIVVEPAGTTGASFVITLPTYADPALDVEADPTAAERRSTPRPIRRAAVAT